MSSRSVLLIFCAVCIAFISSVPSQQHLREKRTPQTVWWQQDQFQVKNTDAVWNGQQQSDNASNQQSNTNPQNFTISDKVFIVIQPDNQLLLSQAKQESQNDNSYGFGGRSSVPHDYNRRSPEGDYDRRPPPPPSYDYDRRPPPHHDFDRRPPPPPPHDYDRRPPPPPPHGYDRRPPPPPPHDYDRRPPPYHDYDRRPPPPPFPPDYYYDGRYHSPQDRSFYSQDNRQYDTYYGHPPPPPHDHRPPPPPPPHHYNDGPPPPPPHHGHPPPPPPFYGHPPPPPFHHEYGRPPPPPPHGHPPPPPPDYIHGHPPLPPPPNDRDSMHETYYNNQQSRYDWDNQSQTTKTYQWQTNENFELIQSSERLSQGVSDTIQVDPKSNPLSQKYMQLDTYCSSEAKPNFDNVTISETDTRPNAIAYDVDFRWNSDSPESSSSINASPKPNRNRGGIPLIDSNDNETIDSVTQPYSTLTQYMFQVMPVRPEN